MGSDAAIFSLGRPLVGAVDDSTPLHHTVAHPRSRVVFCFMVMRAPLYSFFLFPSHPVPLMGGGGACFGDTGGADLKFVAAVSRRHAATNNEEIANRARRVRE